MDFITALKPKQVFPIHDAMLSETGHGVMGLWLQKACDAIGAPYIRLKTGDSLEQ